MKPEFYLLIQVHYKRFVDAISFAEELVDSKLHTYIGNIRIIEHIPEIDVPVP